MRGAIAVFAVLVGACAPKADPPVAKQPEPEPETLKVLVTGFNDWKDLGDPPNVWRCRDNPSCRLLVGDSITDAPDDFDGPLAQALAASGDAIEWSFATLPVTWGVTSERTAYAEYDVVVHIGLGVYDRSDEVFVEAGGYNLRRGTDAAGRAVQEPILSSEGTVVAAPPEVDRKVQAIDARAFGPITARVMPARVENTYLCNETHTLALDAVHRSAAEGGRLKEAYFVHIPQPKDENWQGLAEGVAGVVMALVQRV